MFHLYENPLLSLPSQASKRLLNLPTKGSRGRFFYSSFLEILAVGGAYYTTAWLGLFLAIPPGVATPVWIPSGLALAAILVLGNHVWLGIAAGSFLINIPRLVSSEAPGFAFAPVLIALGISLGSALQALVGAYFIRKWTRLEHLFDRVQHIFKFVWIEMFACLVSPTMGTLSLLLGYSLDLNTFYRNWWTWWTGDLLGVLAVTPFILAWKRPVRNYWDRERLWKAAVYFPCLFVMAYGVFGGDVLVDSLQRILFPYFLFPFVVWAAFWFSQQGVTLSTIIISGTAIWSTIHGEGPFAQKILNESVLALQPFIMTLSITGLIYNAALCEREHAHEELKRNQQSLIDFVENAPVGLHWVGPNGIIIWANEAELKMLGYMRDEYVGHHYSEFHVDGNALEEMLGRLKNHEELQNYEVQLRCKDKSVKHVLISSNVLWENESFLHTRCFTRDITDRKHAEEDLRKAHAQLERRVIQRTRELSEAYKTLETEMAERAKVQRDILQISEREQKRIGQDLHDGLAQQLSGLSFLSKTLHQKLLTKFLPEAKDAAQILEYLKKSIEDTRRISRGFYPVELEKLGLFPALEGLAMDMEKMFDVPCRYQFDSSIHIADERVSAHIYRVTQEAVSNAIKHGKPRRVDLFMKRMNGHVVLVIEDDGVGIGNGSSKEGMGLRIMSYRAKMMSASFRIEAKSEGGTKVIFEFQT